ncbi:MAG: transcription termination/antitermination protein NusA [Kiritimatiellae bacterium]|nr:transcription termination/antitermination protein NusA [Kiritimatiellia bacterium]
MNTDLQNILNYMEKERGIERETLIQAVEVAMQSAARKSMNDEGLRVEIDRKSYDIKAFTSVEVVDQARPSIGYISLTKAQKTVPTAQVGDIIEITVNPGDLGRIAAQTAKQAIMQKIRQAERDIIFEDYKDRIGDIVSGAVRQFSRSDIIVDLGRAEAILPSRERVPTEEYQVGDRIRAYVVDVQNNANGPGIILSRSHPDFVRKLFELEVSEISDGVVRIKGIAREPGYRTKIAVLSTEDKVDPVGACVGMRGMRVKNIVRELSGEKIDIIRWSDDTKTYVTNALSPAKLLKVTIDPADLGIVRVIADSEQLSLAIGKRGQNVRLTAKLIGLKIDIQKDESQVTFEEKVAMAVDALAVIEGISIENAKTLVGVGYLTVDGILAADISELQEATGFDEETAKQVLDAAATTQSSDETEESDTKPNET